MKRCNWCEGTFEKYIQYHDEEWGVPVHKDEVLFEFLILESAQAGLSWSTILKKRDGYKQAFADFDVDKVALMDSRDVDVLVKDARIVRNRNKIEAVINNARQFNNIRQEFGSFDKYCWRFVDGSPKVNAWERVSDVPATTLESDVFAKDLKKRGFKFLGPTTIYAFMQAVGMVNDHTTDCFRYQETIKLR